MKFNHEKQQFEVEGKFLFSLSMWKLQAGTDGTPRLCFNGCAKHLEIAPDGTVCLVAGCPPIVVELTGYTIDEIEKLIKPPKKSRRKK